MNTEPRPDLRVRVTCPICGATALVSPTSIRLSGGLTCSRDQLPLRETPRRSYTRRAEATPA